MLYIFLSCFQFNNPSVYSYFAFSSSFLLECQGFKCTDFSNLCGEENRDHTGIAFLKLPVPRVEHQPEELAFAICKRGNGHGIWQAQPMTFYVLAFEELKSRFDSF